MSVSDQDRTPTTFDLVAPYCAARWEAFLEAFDSVGALDPIEETGMQDPLTLVRNPDDPISAPARRTR